jgi:hypothetical protein
VGYLTAMSESLPEAVAEPALDPVEGRDPATMPVDGAVTGTATDEEVVAPPA